MRTHAATRRTQAAAPRRRRLAAVAATVVLGLSLVACGDRDQPIQAAAAQIAGPSAQPAAAKAASALTLTADSARIPYGAAASVSVSLTAGGAGVAGERIAVTAGGATVTATTDAAGTGTVDLAGLQAGPQAVTASFAGSDTALGAQGSTTVTVDPAAVGLALSLAALPTGATSATAALSAATGVPVAGSVTFGLDGAPLPAVAVTGGGAAVEIPANLPVGDHTVTAAFTPGDPAQLTGAQAASVLSVRKLPATVTAAGKDTVRYGDWATVDVTVRAGAGADLTGPVAVRDSTGAVLAEGSTDAAGHASLGFLNRADPGPTAYTVSFAGSDAVDAAEGGLTVHSAQTNVDLSIDHPDAVKPGDSPTISLAVLGTPDRPTGAATIAVDGNQIAAGQLVDGALSGTAAALPAGEHTIAVSYAGDARFQAHQATATLTVAEPPVNPNAAGAAGLQAGNPCPAAASACIDLANERAWLQSAGQITYGPVPITSGAAGSRTRTGMFSVFWRDKNHKSSLFNNAPMPNSVFFDGDIAFHEGSLYDQSNGCIHLSWDASETFFDTLSVGEGVYVWGAAPY